MPPCDVTVYVTPAPPPNMAAPVLWLAAAALLSTVCEARALQDLNEVFYSEIRDLLNRHTVRQSNEVSPPLRPREVPDWPASLPHLGQVSGVSVDPSGQPVIFHRGPRVWDHSSFNESNHYQHGTEGPIPVDTVLTLDATRGTVINSWGRGLFYMPHGITVCPRGSVWLTDVALHQVFKFRPGRTTPTLVLGRRFEPGSGLRHLCQPTAVAVASTGDFFVADGYCNSRVLMFSAQGSLLRVLPQPPEFLSLQVPHSLTLLEPLDLLCIADRENMRVACPRAGLQGYEARKPPAVTIQEPDLGRVFGVAASGNFVFAVNGPTSPIIPVRGFTLDPKAEAIIDHWGPASGFNKPHAMAVSPNGTALYIVEIGPNKVWKFDLV
uniref:peptidylamidoglycolate lyase n=1 Tax=Timema monikensis TaxID=170555 RepID=A0A7R9E5H0_9NEOP|nr:unnamed protein product [Timema monikensis]